MTFLHAVLLALFSIYIAVTEVVMRGEEMSRRHFVNCHLPAVLSTANFEKGLTARGFRAQNYPAESPTERNHPALISNTSVDRTIFSQGSGALCHFHMTFLHAVLFALFSIYIAVTKIQAARKIVRFTVEMPRPI